MEDPGKLLQGECLVQAKLVGDAYPTAYAAGTTMRNSQTVTQMHYVGQTVDDTPDKIVIPLPECCPQQITAVYAGTGASARITDGKLVITPDQEMEAIAVYLT